MAKQDEEKYPRRYFLLGDNLAPYMSMLDLEAKGETREAAQDLLQAVDGILEGRTFLIAFDPSESPVELMEASRAQEEYREITEGQFKTLALITNLRRLQTSGIDTATLGEALWSAFKPRPQKGKRVKGG